MQGQGISGGPPPPLPDLKAQAKKLRAKREAKAKAKAASGAVTEKKGATVQGKKRADEASLQVSRKAVAIRPPAINPIKARLKQIGFPPREERLPPHSPAVETGLLNMDMPGAMAGVPGMENNPMASMLGSLMGGNDEEEEEEKKEEKPVPGPSRRQEKRVVRVGR